MIDVSATSEGNRFRRARVHLLRDLIGKTLEEKETCSVLDLGGTYTFWHVWRDYVDWSRTEITCINMHPDRQEVSGEPRVQILQGDACDLSHLQDDAYDIVFSNSVIEHVGVWRNMKSMATEVRRLAPRYIVQTPNFWFPIEPHARTPFLHWLPEPWAYRIVMARKCGYWTKQHSVSEAVETVQSARLLDMRQMQALFADAVIIRERFLGITKALIAIKGHEMHTPSAPDAV